MSEPRKRAPWISPDTPEPFCEWCGGRVREGERYCSVACNMEAVDELNEPPLEEETEEEE